MYNCNKCNDTGYVFDTENKLTLCQCKYHAVWSEYLKPVGSLAHLSGEKKIKYSNLTNRSQVITNTVENIAALMKLMLSVWFPEDYAITSLEEINTISFKRHSIYKSIQEFADNYKYFIVDITLINTLRAKSPKWNISDSMCMLDMLKTIIRTSQKIIFIIKPGIIQFTKQYQELCKGFNDFGIEYFHTENYKKFSIKNNEGVYDERP
ncbi:MAG: hypothetical protein LBI03_09145 [Clostridiales bacterium]|nr:hypothetical protein [Clostridiales bacterium]